MPELIGSANNAEFEIINKKNVRQYFLIQIKHSYFENYPFIASKKINSCYRTVLT